MSFTYIGSFQVHGGDADTLWKIGSGDAALLYLFLRKNDRMPSEGEAEEAGMPPEALARAKKALLDAKLIVRAPSAAKETAPLYETKEITEGITRDEGFAHVVHEAERLAGRPLSPSDLQTLYSIHAWRGLPPEVLTLMLHFLHKDFERRFGRKPTMKNIGVEAEYWEKAGVFTAEAAQAHIKKLEKLRSELTRTLIACGIRGREPSATEKNYAQGWIQMGFAPDAVALAYDKTVTQKGQWSWPYCHKILDTWHKMGLHTVEEINRSAPGPQRRQQYAERGGKRPLSPPGETERAAMEKARKYLEDNADGDGA
ncbi:MAG: DnaD domain protein [Oscillospiraceae bacterium]|jgi:DnaD/phage-associated family protein|nr:DnaD domain protein [Oscillospiraceae bacterium]